LGAGDWLMATAAAEHVPEGRRAVFGDGQRANWHEVFDNNPKIAGTAGRDTVWIPDFPGHRPYIASFIKRERYLFREDFRAPYGKVYLSDEERDWAGKQVSGDYIIVEPYIKDDMPQLKIGQNKAWDKWDELLKLDYPWLQIGTKEPKTRQVRTNIRQALAMVAGAKLVVTTDGMLHHAAAALGVPAIVLWGGVVSPKILGYPTHINIWNGAKSCGTFAHVCQHCREAMQSITLDQVRKHL
jgi:hypothetical protein